MPMRGQKTRGRASAGTCRSPRGTPPYFTERQRAASQPSLGDAGEAPPPVPETSRELSVSELFRRLPSHFVSKPGVTTHVIDGFVIQESPEPFTTTAETTSAVGVQHNCHVSSDAPPSPSHPAAVTTPDPSPSRARPSKSTTCGRQGRKAADPFLVQTAQPPVTTRTPTATSTAHSTPERTPTSSASEKTVVLVPMTQSAAHVTAAKSKGTSASPSKPRRETASQVFSAPLQQPAPPPPRSMNTPEVWTVEDVVEFIAEQPGCERYAEKFRYQEIDGEALFLLKEHHLMTAMNMKLGPALKVCAMISSLRAAP